MEELLFVRPAANLVPLSAEDLKLSKIARLLRLNIGSSRDTAIAQVQAMPASLHRDPDLWHAVDLRIGGIA